MNITVVRHGQTPMNITKLCDVDPKADTNLTMKGRIQAQQVGNKLRNKKFDIVYVSEFLRTQLTADAINTRAKRIIDKRLNDAKVGEFEF